MSTNGLTGASAHRKVDVPYYLSQGAPIVAPTLISPLQLESADAGNGEAVIAVGGFSGGVVGPYTGALFLEPGPSVAGGAAAGIAIRSGAGKTIVEVGADAELAADLFIAGPQGVGRVYDEVYNPVINGTAVAATGGALPGSPATRTFVYTPDKTGAYLLQVNVNIRNADSIPLDGFLEWVLSAAGSEVQFASNTLNSNALIKVVGMDEINGAPGGIAEPTDFTTSDLCFLTAGVPVTFSIVTARNSTVGGLSWAIQNYDARLIQMC